METALYLIPAPLGETPVEQVIPAYNAEIIRNIPVFIVENVRSARRFLKKIDRNRNIDGIEFYELNEHTKPSSIGNYLDPLKEGKTMGVISEAGCPAVADPGATVVALAQKQNLKVIPLVGPSSLLMAVMASGFSGQSFSFNGYLPAKVQEREQKLRQLEQRCYRENQTQLFIETPYRNAHMIESILKTCRPETRLCIAAGITTPDEYIRTKTVAAWKKTQLPALDTIPAVFLIYKG